MGIAHKAKSEPALDPPGTWRDELSRRAALVSTALFLIAALIVALATPVRSQGGSMAIVMLLGGCATALAAFSRRLNGTVSAWLVIVPTTLTSLIGFAKLGPLAGPAIVFVVAIVLVGLLLGRRTMMAHMVIALAAVGAIGWATVHAIIPWPIASVESLLQGSSWFRTVAALSLATGLLGVVVVDVVSRLEKSIELANQQTMLREQAERAKAETELRLVANRQMETIGQIAAGIAHDFNNNLAAIIGCAELLKTEFLQDEASRDLLGDILASAQRATQLTRQLLVYSRRAQMVLAPTDLHQSLENAAALLRRSFEPNIEFDINLNAESSNVLADANLLDNALLNLILNARDAMPNGGRISISTSWIQVSDGSRPDLQQGLYVVVEIADTGVGISADVLPNIFDPFFTTKPAGKGTGLGLATALGTIKSFKGSIEAESEVGCGTILRVFLPCIAPSVSSIPPETPHRYRGSGRLLLIDDDALVRRAAAATLQSLGYEVVTATDGVNALEVFKASAERFTVALLDLQMPQMNGEATFEELRRLDPRLPIVIWSGYSGDTNVQDLMRRGAAGFIQKPYRIADLARVVLEASNGNSVSSRVNPN